MHEESGEDVQPLVMQFEQSIDVTLEAIQQDAGSGSCDD